MEKVKDFDINTIIDNALGWMKECLLNGDKLDEWFNEYCDANNEPEGDREQLIKYINGLTRITKWCFGKTESKLPICSRYDDEVNFYSAGRNLTNEKHKKIVAERIAERIKHPFKHWDDCEWLPISEAIRVTFTKHTSTIAGVNGTPGQKIILAFLIKGNEGEINWQDIYYALS